MANTLVIIGVVCFVAFLILFTRYTSSQKSVQLKEKLDYNEKFISYQLSSVNNFSKKE
jgi:hypothetical protein